VRRAARTRAALPALTGRSTTRCQGPLSDIVRVPKVRLQRTKDTAPVLTPRVRALACRCCAAAASCRDVSKDLLTAPAARRWP
jgi:hypothetical protein